MAVVRISRGRFAPEAFEAISRRLGEAQASLVPAIQALEGCLHYWAGIDAASSSMVNVSVWRTLEHALQMESLAEMRALAGEFIALGVGFERPILNYDVLWETSSA